MTTDLLEVIVSEIGRAGGSQWKMTSGQKLHHGWHMEKKARWVWRKPPKSRKTHFASGARNPNSKVTDEQVRDMRARRLLGETYVAIARVHGVSPQSAESICKRKTYAHV